jgi:hydrogenase-4 transcriptional activator
VRLSAETLDLFDAFPWPGNVRQLRNEVQRAVALSSEGGLIEPEMLSPALAGTADVPPGHASGGRRSLQRSRSSNGR